MRIWLPCRSMTFKKWSMPGQSSPRLPGHSWQESRLHPEEEHDVLLSRTAQDSSTAPIPGLSSRPGETPLIEMSPHLFDWKRKDPAFWRTHSYWDNSTHIFCHQPMPNPAWNGENLDPSMAMSPSLSSRRVLVSGNKASYLSEFQQKTEGTLRTG